MTSRLEQLCIDRGLKMTEQRRVVARVLSDSADHPDVEAVFRRAAEIDPKISIATVYRTVRLFEEASILERHEFGDGRARYEERPTEHHDHLIDMRSGEVLEFHNETIEELQRRIAAELGYELVGHKLELYAVPQAAKPVVKPPAVKPPAANPPAAKPPRPRVRRRDRRGPPQSGSPLSGAARFRCGMNPDAGFAGHALA